MKYLLAFVLALSCVYCVPAVACTCVDCQCDNCTCKADTGKRVALPNDANKLTVTVFAKDAAQAKAFLARHPEIRAYKAGNHYNVYTKENSLTKARFGSVSMPSAYVQKPNGTIVASAVKTNGDCLFGRWRNRHQEQEQEQEKEEAVVDEDEVVEEETPAPADESNPWLLVGLAVLAVVGGVGSQFYEELKAK